MKRLPILMVHLGIIFTHIFSSCDGNEQNTNADTAKNNAATFSQTSPAQSTIINSPQPMMIVRYRINSFTKWKASYDAHDSLWQANGLKSYIIGRGIPDSNMILVAIRTEDVNRAKAFAKDTSLRGVMERGGVISAPTFHFINWTFQDTGTVGSDIRSVVMLKTKAWTPWKASFESGRQERRQNGLVDRAYGHEAGDTTKAIVVVAVTDTAKARAYWASDQLKQRRAQGGVIGDPQRFIFRVVQRY